MNTVETLEMEPVAVNTRQLLHLPLGLLGFEQIKNYALVAHPHETPFRWLEVSDDPTLAFLVLSPAEVLPDYQPDVSANDVEFLGLASPSEALVFCIVTLRGKNRATLNLKGPIVVNRHTLKGKQVVPVNAAEYSLQHPLPFCH